jgi:hypothetical protein
MHLAIAALVLAAFNLPAQTEAELNIQSNAGLTIIGDIGQVDSIESVTDLAAAKSYWIDPAAALHENENSGDSRNRARYPSACNFPRLHGMSLIWRFRVGVFWVPAVR